MGTLKAWIIRAFGLPGSWKWAARQMRKGKCAYRIRLLDDDRGQYSLFKLERLGDAPCPQLCSGVPERLDYKPDDWPHSGGIYWSDVFIVFSTEDIDAINWRVVE